MQEAQKHRPAQPGFQVMEPQMEDYNRPPTEQEMLQQYMMAQHMRQEIAPPPPEQAIQEIQNQIRTFYTNYPGYVNVPQQGHSPVIGMQQMHSPVLSMSNGLAPSIMHTPVMVQRPTTPTNGYLPTPPTTNKTMRVIRNLDVAPMGNISGIPTVHIEQPMGQDALLFHDPFGSEYCSSSYQSSLVDPMSPSRSPAKGASMRATSMPTLFEDSAVVGASSGMLSQDQLLMAAAEGNYDMRAYYADSPMRPQMSPREMMLQGLEIDATIEDTGISAEEVQSYISEQDPSDSKWTCLFPECGKTFGRKENIRSHVQTHLGDRQFKCNHCNKCFVRQHDLKRHAKIHSGDKPHKCPCGNGFARQDALTRHRQRGVCEGALPGFERREVKRGRPRKSRPDMEDRVDKATRARQLDARRGSEATYTSSSSGSVRSDPFTPPNMNDNYESDTFGQLTDVESQFDAFVGAYQDDTPPTSPLTAGASPRKRENYQTGTTSFDFANMNDNTSPAAVSHHSPAISSPSTSHASPPPVIAAQSQPEAFSDSVFDWGAIEAQPALCGDAFSPAAASSAASEFDGCFDNTFEPTTSKVDSAFMSSNGFVDFANQLLYKEDMSISDDVFAREFKDWYN